MELKLQVHQKAKQNHMQFTLLFVRVLSLQNHLLKIADKLQWLFIKWLSCSFVFCRKSIPVWGERETEKMQFLYGVRKRYLLWSLSPKFLYDHSVMVLSYFSLRFWILLPSILLTSVSKAGIWDRMCLIMTTHIRARCMAVYTPEQENSSDCYSVKRRSFLRF